MGETYYLVVEPDIYLLLHLVRMLCLSYPVVVVVFTLTHRYNAVRGHRTDSNNSGAQDYLRRKTNKKQKVIHTITETNRIPQTKTKRWDQRTYVSRYISFAKRVAAETETEETAYHKKKTGWKQTMSKSKSKKHGIAFFCSLYSIIAMQYKSLCRDFVTTELVSLYGRMKSQDGNGVWWVSTGSNQIAQREEHTHY